jgi:hypothetical protein
MFSSTMKYGVIANNVSDYINLLLRKQEPHKN